MFLGGGSVLIAVLWACKKGFITIKKKILKKIRKKDISKYFLLFNIFKNLSCN